MHLPTEIVIRAIDTAPLNRGLDGATWVADKSNVPLVFEGGDVAIFTNEGDGVFEAHFLFNSRGRKAIERVREAFAIMFEKHGAEVIFGLVFVRKMKLVARWAGAKSAGNRWTPDGVCELFTITKSRGKR